MGRRRVLKGVDGEAEGFSLAGLPPVARRRRRTAGTGARPGRTEQFRDAVRRQIHSEDFPPAGIRHESGPGNRTASWPSTSFPMCRRWRAALEYRARDGKEDQPRHLERLHRKLQRRLGIYARYAWAAITSGSSSLPEEQAGCPQSRPARSTPSSQELSDLGDRAVGHLCGGGAVAGRTHRGDASLPGERQGRTRILRRSRSIPSINARLFQSMRNQAVENLGLLRAELKSVPAGGARRRGEGGGPGDARF